MRPFSPANKRPPIPDVHGPFPGNGPLDPVRPYEDVNTVPVDPYFGPHYTGERQNFASGIDDTTRQLPTVKQMAGDRALSHLGVHVPDHTTTMPAITDEVVLNLRQSNRAGMHESPARAREIGHTPRHHRV